MKFIFALLAVGVLLPSCTVININIDGENNTVESVEIGKDTDVAADVEAGLN